MPAENDSDGDQRPTHRWLEAIRVSFISIEQKGNYRVIVAVDGSEPFSREFRAGEEIRLEKRFECPLGSNVHIELWKQRRWMLNRAAEPWCQVDIQIMNDERDVRNVHDPKGQVEFSVSFSRMIPGQNVRMFTSAKAFIKSAFCGLEAGDSPLTEDLRNSFLNARGNAQKAEIRDKLGRARTVVHTVGRAIGDMDRVVIATAYQALGSLAEACDARASCLDYAADIVDELDKFLSLNKHVPEHGGRSQLTAPGGDILRLLGEAAIFVRDSSSRHPDDQLPSAYLETISRFKSDFGAALQKFLLLQLNPSPEARVPGRGAECLEGTRTALLRRITLWFAASAPSALPTLSPYVQPRQQSSLFWLQGLAGSGKSTIALTFARSLEKHDDPISRFFCKREVPRLSNPKRVLPTLAYQLAEHYDGYREAIINFLTDPANSNIASFPISEQYKLLFEDCTETIAESISIFHAFMVDGLDECGSIREQVMLARHLLALANLSPKIKVIVTSRIVEEIRAVFVADGQCTVANVSEEAQNNVDIRRYIMAKLEEMDISLPKEVIDMLVKQASGLFIWCSTLFKYVEESMDPRELLERLASERPPPRADGSYGWLYKLYDHILSAAVTTDDGRTLMVNILSIISVSSSNQPLSAVAIASFLRRKVGPIRKVLLALNAVLSEDWPIRGPVRAYHGSFLDYLRRNLDRSESTNNGWPKLQTLHRMLAVRSLEIMNEELKFNICDLADSTALNRDITNLEELIAEKISESLQYSAQFWFSHLRASQATPAEVETLVFDLICTVKILFYLEVLSLLDVIETGARILYECSWFYNADNRAISDASAEFERFISSYSEAMQSVAHTYLSAMAWAPTNSYPGKLMVQHFVHGPVIRIAGDEYWDVSVWTNTIGQYVLGVAYSPDGAHVVSALDDNTLRIWDAQTGMAESDRLEGHTLEVEAVAYSPDGRSIVSGSSDHTLRVWDAQTATPIGDPLQGHTSAVSSVIYSPDGKYIASGSYDKTVRIWDAETHSPVGDHLEGHDDYVRCVAYSPDSQFIASGSDDKTVRFWEASTRTLVGEKLVTTHEDYIRCLAYSPNGKHIVTGSDDTTLRIWDVETRAPICDPLRGHSDYVKSVAYSPDGGYIVSGSDDRTLRIWDAHTGKPLSAAILGHSSSVTSVAFSRDGRHIISGSTDGTMRLWEAQRPGSIRQPLSGHADTVQSVAYSPDGCAVVSGSSDCSVRIWETSTGNPVFEPLKGHEDYVRCVAYSPDGCFIASASDDHTVRLWDARTGQPEGEPLQGHTDYVRCVAFAPDGQFLASGSDDNTVRIWDVATRAMVGEALDGHSNYVRCIAYSPDGRRIISGSEDNTLRIWDAETRAPIGVPLEGHAASVLAVIYSANGERVISGSADSTIRVWDARTGRPIGEPWTGHTDYVRCLASHPDGHCILSCSDDGNIRTWDAESGRPIGEPFKGSSSFVSSVAYSPDGSHIVFGSSDGTVRVWDTRSDTPEWYAQCSEVDEADGWVQDEDGRLIFWIPFQYRRRFRNHVRLVIGPSEPKRVTPVVDVDKLYKFKGKDWTLIYNDNE